MVAIIGVIACMNVDVGVCLHMCIHMFDLVCVKTCISMYGDSM